MAKTNRAALSGTTVAIAVAGSVMVLPEGTLAEKDQPLDQRKAIYAPWSPEQMQLRRKEAGLIGPGTTKPVPAPAFPSYLKKPDSVDQLMPQARAAARQPGAHAAWPRRSRQAPAHRRRRVPRLQAEHDGAGGD